MLDRKGRKQNYKEAMFKLSKKEGPKNKEKIN